MIYPVIYKRKTTQEEKEKQQKDGERESHLNWFEEELYDVWWNVIEPWTIQCDKIENHVHIWYLNQVWMRETIHVTVWQNKFCYNSVLVYFFSKTSFWRMLRIVLFKKWQVARSSSNMKSIVTQLQCCSKCTEYQVTSYGLIADTLCPVIDSVGDNAANNTFEFCEGLIM